MCEPLAATIGAQRLGFYEQVFTSQALNQSRLAIIVGTSAKNQSIISHCPFCGTNLATEYDYANYLNEFGVARAKAILQSCKNPQTDIWYDEETHIFSQHQPKTKSQLVNVPTISFAFAITLIQKAGGENKAREILKTAHELASVVVRVLWTDSNEYSHYFYTQLDGVVVAVREAIEPLGMTFYSYDAMLQNWRETYGNLKANGNLSIENLIFIELEDLKYALNILDEENE